MEAKFIVRVLNEHNELLGWGELMTHARGDGCLWAPSPFECVIDVSGRAAWLSYHWADLHLEWRAPLSQDVQAGTILRVQYDREVVRVGDPPVGLPGVTMKGAVKIGVPAGSLGVAG